MKRLLVLIALSLVTLATCLATIVQRGRGYTQVVLDANILQNSEITGDGSPWTDTAGQSGITTFTGYSAELSALAGEGPRLQQVVSMLAGSTYTLVFELGNVTLTGDGALRIRLGSTTVQRSILTGDLSNKVYTNDLVDAGINSTLLFLFNPSNTGDRSSLEVLWATLVLKSI